MSPHPPHDLDRPALLAALRARAARLEHGGDGEAPAAAGPAAVPLCAPIDAALPGGAGLPRAALHEVLSADPGAADGFCALLLARAAAGPVLWIAPGPEAWPPGMARFGLSPAELVLVQAPREADALWAMEETLRCPAVAAALLVVARAPDPAAARRLQLAAEAGGTLGVLLRPDAEDAPQAMATPAAALTRWRVAALAGGGGGGGPHGLGDPRWRLDLLRCRGGGRPGSWQVTWRPAAEALELDGEAAETAAEAAPPARRAARRPR